MSYNELNKGILTLVDIDTEHFTDEDFETYIKEGLMVISKEIYSVEYDIQRQEAEGFAHVNVLEDGRIEFFTCHYNGGASLEEVIERALEEVVQAEAFGAYMEKVYLEEEPG